jgi:signal transduction histidine kinase
MRKISSVNPWIIIKILCLVAIYTNDLMERHLYISNSYYYQYTILLIFLLVNDLYRYKSFIKKENLFFISLLMSMFISLVAYSHLDSGIYPYFLLLLFDIIVLAQNLSKAKKYSVLTTHVCIFSAFIVSVFLGDRSKWGYWYSFFYSTSHFSVKPLLDIFSTRELMVEVFLWTYSPYIFSYVFLYLIFFQIAQRNRYKVLYEENETVNRKLAEYAKRVEEIAVNEERNRIAQEVHDSVGHSLVALIMHLNFLDKKCESDKQETKQLVAKCLDLAKESLSNIRKAVYAMRDMEAINGFSESVNKLIDKFKDIQVTAISLSITGEIEDLSPDMKNTLYKTIRESITNSIRHGTPGKIDIVLEKKEDYLQLYIEDNGSGTNSISIGTGLKSIEKRIYSLGGKIHFSSKQDEGFKTFVSFDLCLKQAGFIEEG